VNGVTISFIVAGSFLILVGVVLLIIKIQPSDSLFQGPGRIMVSGPVGLVVIVIGVVCLGLSVASSRVNNNNSNPNNTTSPTPTPATTHRMSATLTSPSDDTSVSRSQGFTASGTEAFLGSDTIWILDYNGGYTADQPAAIAGGRWSAVDQPLGYSSNHLPYKLTMVAVFANRACAKVLTRLSNSPNDYTARLPAGCTPFGQVIVNVTRP